MQFCVCHFYQLKFFPSRYRDYALDDICNLLILWVLGLATGATLNGFIHILLVIAIVVVLLRVIQGRRLA